MSKNFEYWNNRIKCSKTESGLNKVVEEMADCETITNSEYCDLYSIALDHCRSL